MSNSKATAAAPTGQLNALAPSWRRQVRGRLANFNLRGKTVHPGTLSMQAIKDNPTPWILNRNPKSSVRSDASHFHVPMTNSIRKQKVAPTAKPGGMFFSPAPTDQKHQQSGSAPPTMVFAALARAVLNFALRPLVRTQGGYDIIKSRPLKTALVNQCVVEIRGEAYASCAARP
ncbi:MAG TPA: hypothetical protein VFZ51_09080 [Woeseiaceae bacterium]